MLWAQAMGCDPTPGATADGAAQDAEARDASARDASLGDAGPSDAQVVTSTPVHLGVMLHLEGNLQLADAPMFNQIDQAVREVLDLFDSHGGIITIESEQPYAEAAAQWAPTDNALLYSLSLGQGVGTHCDMGDTETDPSFFAANKTLVDAIVGVEENLGCSGGWVRGDWASSAYDGGFRYLDGVVMRAYLGVPLANRPIDPDTGSPYTDQKIIQVVYHDPAPPELFDRIYPRRLADTNDLEGDLDGRLLLLTGEIGEISSLSEGRSNCFPACAFDQDDLDVIVSTLDQVYTGKDHSRFAMIYLHFPLDTLRSEPAPGLSAAEKRQIVGAWLDTMADYQAQGRIQWVTMKQALESFLSWEP